VKSLARGLAVLQTTSSRTNIDVWRPLRTQRIGLNKAAPTTDTDTEKKKSTTTLLTYHAKRGETTAESYPPKTTSTKEANPENMHGKSKSSRETSFYYKTEINGMWKSQATGLETVTNCRRGHAWGSLFADHRPQVRVRFRIRVRSHSFWPMVRKSSEHNINSVPGKDYSTWTL